MPRRAARLRHGAHQLPGVLFSYLAAETLQQGGHVLQPDAVIGSCCVKGTLRHVGMRRVVWILDYSCAAGLANRSETRAAVPERASQDDCDDP